MANLAEATIVPVYQYHLDLTDGNETLYFYSTNDDFGQGWTQDKVVWYGSSTPFPGMSPVNQYSQQLPDGSETQYFFTMETFAPPGWQFDQVGWYAIDLNQWTENIRVYQYAKPLENDSGYKYLYTTNPDFGGGWKNISPIFAAPATSSFLTTSGSITTPPTEHCWELQQDDSFPVYFESTTSDYFQVGDSVAVIAIGDRHRDCPGPQFNLYSIVKLASSLS